MTLGDIAWDAHRALDEREVKVSGLQREHECICYTYMDWTPLREENERMGLRWKR